MAINGHVGAGASGVVNRGGKLGDVTNHVSIAQLMTSRLGELVPNVEPVTILLVDLLATDFNLNILDEDVAEPVEPPESLTRGNSNGGEFYA